MKCARCNNAGEVWVHSIILCKKCYKKLQEENRVWDYSCHHWCMIHGVVNHPADIEAGLHGHPGPKSSPVRKVSKEALKRGA